MCMQKCMHRTLTRAELDDLTRKHEECRRAQRAKKPRKTVIRTFSRMQATPHAYTAQKSPSEEPDVEWAYDVPCSQCSTRNIDCYKRETGNGCRACGKGRRKCDYSTSHALRSASPPLAIRRERRQCRPRCPFNSATSGDAIGTAQPPPAISPSHVPCFKTPASSTVAGPQLHHAVHSPDMVPNPSLNTLREGLDALRTT